MLQLYKYLYYRLYSWNLKKWGEIDGPQYNALLGVTFMMYINLYIPLSILHMADIVTVFPDKGIPIVEILYLGLALLIINYFWLVYDHKFLYLEKKYKNESKEKSKRNAVLLWTYFLFSFFINFFLLWIERDVLN